MKRKKIAAFAAALLLFTACGKEEAEPPAQTQQNGSSGAEVAGENTNTPDSVAAEDVTREITGAAVELAPPEGEVSAETITALSKASVLLFERTAATQEGHASVLLSPLSFFMGMGMTENGASGETLAQMEEILNGGASAEELNLCLYDLAQRMNAAEEVEWGLADSMWIENVEPSADFLSRAQSWYGAQLFETGFGPDAVEQINLWAQEKTNGRISSLLEEVSPDTRMLLVSTADFSGKWQEPYENTDVFESRRFDNADGSMATVTMLYSEEERYFRLSYGTGFLKPYAGGEFSFFAIRPDNDVSVDDYFVYLVNDGEDIAAAIRDSKYGDVRVQIPEFSFSFEKEMKQVCVDMGLTLPFDELNADFSAMTDGAENSLYMGEIHHKTAFRLERSGTQASAATAVEMQVKGMEEAPDRGYPVYVYLDRSFVYGIADNKTGLPIFLGCVSYL